MKLHLVGLTKIHKEKRIMKISNIILLVLLVVITSCTPGGSTLLSMAKFAGAPIPDVIEITSAAISIPMGMKEIYNDHHTKKAKNNREKLVFCLIEINKDKTGDEKLELDTEEIDLLITGKIFDVKDDPRRAAVAICMNDEQREFK
jgi:hypothetical protein